MTLKQHDKHLLRGQYLEEMTSNGSILDAAGPTPDGLGTWEGGPVALKGSPRWVAEKSHSSRTGNAKNTPGIDYATKITHRQDADFSEVRVIENGDVMLYNVKTDAWDIKGDTVDIPHYIDENDKEWAFNFETAEWDVPVEELNQNEEVGVVEVERLDSGDDIASAIA